jgi:uncharacterized protein (TIGR03435 family)
MQCNELRKHFADYVKEQLPAAVQTRLAQHLTECGSCTAELDALTDVWVKLGTLPVPEAAVTAMNSRFHEALEDYRRNPKPASRAEIWYWAAGAAASVLLVFLVSMYFLRGPSQVSTATVAEVDGAIYRTWGGTTDRLEAGAPIKLGEELRSEGGAVFALADGSLVEMRSKSVVTLESAIDGLRIRLKQGSVIVTAAKQREGHLYVQTKDFTVSVVGTVFLVNAEESGSHVAVIEGEVHVLQGETAQTLLSGEQASTAPTMAVRPVAEEISWSRQAMEHVALLTQLQGVPTLAVPQPPSVAPAFEVAAILPGDPDNPLGGYRFVTETVTLHNQSLKNIIVQAYGVKDHQVIGPDTLASEKYSITARAPSGTPNAQLRSMLQSLLVDRFKMVVRRETRGVPGFALVVSDSGPKIKEIGGDSSSDSSSWQGGGTVFPSSMEFTGPMSSLVKELSPKVGNQSVVDRTGLTGRYSFALTYGSAGPSLATALENELGLKLEPTSTPVEFLVIEHIEKPSEN